MKPEEFVQEYEKALSSHGWEAVDPLIHDDASVTFSDGSAHRGKAEVKSAFERNFASIRDESYSISNVYWVIKTPEIAVFLFNFSWKGIVNGRSASGSGVGTSVLANDMGRWKLLVEHLGKHAS